MAKVLDDPEDIAASIKETLEVILDDNTKATERAILFETLQGHIDDLKESYQ